MHHVGTIDWSFADRPAPPNATASGLARVRIIGPDHGAVHADLYAGALAPGGWLAPHVHSYEEALYVLEGELLVRIEDRVHRLLRGDHVLFPIGTRHGLGNAGERQARWLSLNSPQKRDLDSPWPDTFYEPAQDLTAMEAEAVRPPFGDPTLRLVGHDDGNPLSVEAVTGTGGPGSSPPVSVGDMAERLVSGISVTPLVDGSFGADLLTIVSVDCQIHGAASSHDHPFEEAYVILAGEVECRLDGDHYTLHPGDVAWSGVGSVHEFWNVGTEHVRWIETQTPQPPIRHAHRWASQWERYAQRTRDRS